jgi:hypothetical protein
MFDRFVGIAMVIAATTQIAVGITFFGALTAMTLMGFSVIPTPY